MQQSKDLTWKTNWESLIDYPSTDYFCVHSLLQGNEVGFFRNEKFASTAPIGDINFEYSLDKVTWYPYIPNTYIRLNNYVYFRGTNSVFVKARMGTYAEDYAHFFYNIQFKAKKLCAISGKLSTLIDKDPNAVNVSIPANAGSSEDDQYKPQAGFRYVRTTDVPLGTTNSRGLFGAYSKLGTAKYLILDNLNLVPYGFNGLFYGCDELTEGPELKATNIPSYSYTQMFAGCKNLVTPPKIHATTATTDGYASTSACNQMFESCSRLNKLNKLYIASVGSYGLMGMYANCPKINLYTTLSAEHSTEYKVPFEGSGSGAWLSGSGFANIDGQLGYLDFNTTYYTSNLLI